jgi:hypothetical protein
MRDYQRKRLYDWERAEVLWRDEELLDLDICRYYANNVHPGVTVRDGRGRRSAYAVGNWLIKLPRWSRTRPIILHECAHLKTRDHHGPMFVACFIHLLHLHLRMSETALRMSAIDSGLKVDTAKVFRLNG